MDLEDYFVSEKGSNHQLLKQNNHNLIKKHIYRHSPISRVEICHILGQEETVRRLKLGLEKLQQED